jgi:hypothetical protein
VFPQRPGKIPIKKKKKKRGKKEFKIRELDRIKIAGRMRTGEA